MTGILTGNNARTEEARQLCAKLNDLFCRQDEKIVGLEKAIGLCQNHLKIADKLFDYPQNYGCPQCQRNRTCELEEITSELLSSLRMLVLFIQAETPVNPRSEPWRVAMNKARSAIEHADNFSASDQPGGCLNEVGNGVAADA